MLFRSGSGFVFDFTGTFLADGTIYSIISGGTINGWNSLNIGNFTNNGTALTADRMVISSSGKVTFVDGFTTLYWNRYSNSTWDTTSYYWRTGNTLDTAMAGWTFKSGTLGSQGTGDSVVFDKRYLEKWCL